MNWQNDFKSNDEKCQASIATATDNFKPAMKLLKIVINKLIGKIK